MPQVTFVASQALRPKLFCWMGNVKIRVAHASIIFTLILIACYVRAIYASASVIEPRVQVLGESIYLPLVVKTEPKDQPLLNGDFEQGPVQWREYSLQGWAIILPAKFLPVEPHSGIWSAWLGGDYDEVNGIWQTVRIPSNRPILTFYYWIASSDICGFDVALVTIDLDEVVDSFWLCTNNDTYGWVRRTIDLTAYADQIIELDILVGTDETLNSNLFIDDVSLFGSAAAISAVGDARGLNTLKSAVISPTIPLTPLTTNRSERWRSYSDLLRNYREGDTNQGDK